jgi:hypothetical protein
MGIADLSRGSSDCKPFCGAARPLAKRGARWQARRMSAAVETYKFTVEEFHKLWVVGIFEESDRVENAARELSLTRAC